MLLEETVRACEAAGIARGKRVGIAPEKRRYLRGPGPLPGCEIQLKCSDAARSSGQKKAFVETQVALALTGF